MKKLLTLMLAVVMLCACGNDVPDTAETEVRNYVDIRRKETWYDLECIGTDYSLIENIIPRTTQLVMVQVNSADLIRYSGNYNFRYSCEILKLYRDDSASLSVGDTITVATTEGNMKANDAAALLEYPLTYHGKKTLTETYTDNDYISSSHWNAVPIETGRTYILYLSSEPVEKYGYYNEIGYSYLYEAVGEDIFTGSERVLSDKKLADVEEEIAEQLRLYGGE